MRPRDYLIVPAKFGTDAVVQWKKVKPSDISSLETARLQHECASAIRRSAKGLYGSVKKYCEASGQSYQRVGQVLRGDRVMRLDDIGSAVARLGLSVRFVSRYSEVSGAGRTVVAGNSDRRDSVGAFYTPDEIASYMVDCLALDGGARVLEPSFGDGAFLSALLRRGAGRLDVVGVETDDVASDLAVKVGLLDESHVVRSDFFDVEPHADFDSVVGNPPYVRLRAVDRDEQAKALAVAASHEGVNFGEESSLWIPFLVKAVDHLREGGSVAFVLPYEVTYVRYARSLWDYIGSRFGSIRVVRIHERVFPDLMQDVVLFFCLDYGGSCEEALYECFESVADMLSGNAVVSKRVSVERVVSGDRVFLEAMVPDDVLDVLTDTGDDVVRCMNETMFHIGYVCGNKSFFHPSAAVVESYGLPESSLVPTAMSSRRLSGYPLFTSEKKSNDVLWLPEGSLSDGEQAYVESGERDGVHKGYKCRIRNPWWRVPMVKRPDVIMSVFSDAPRVMLNDGAWTFSNSLMGANMGDGTDPKAFVETWYTVLTLLSVELEVHSLGGGVLVAVPNEANRVMKLSAKRASGSDAVLRSISDALVEGDVDAAYHVGDSLLTEMFGADFVRDAWGTVQLLRAWRKGL